MQGERSERRPDERSQDQPQPGERNERTRIYSHITQSRFLHVEDALSIGKVRLYVGAYVKGQGAKATAFHFLDVEDARVLFSDMAWGKPVDFADFKGTTNGNGPQSRVLKVKSTTDKAGRAKTWFQVSNGPGQVIGQGAIKPSGKPDAEVSIPLSEWEARRLAFSVLAHIQAWDTVHVARQAKNQGGR